MYTREELNEKNGAAIKSILKKELKIQYPASNKKEQNIELILANQSQGTNTNNQDVKVIDTKNEILEKEELIVSTLDIITLEKIYKTLKSDNKVEELETRITDATIYENTSISYSDDFSFEKEEELYEGLALIVNNKGEVIAKAYLQPNKTDYVIVADSKDIDYEKLQGNRKCRVVVFKKDAKEYLDGSKKFSEIIQSDFYIGSIECRVKYEEMKTTSKILCIDFGTSNTTMGSYGVLDEEKNEIELVEFIDYTKEPYKKSNLYPTLIYVKDCSDKENIKYLFGYEAKKQLINENYSTEATTFFEIKRWISNLDHQEEITDQEENTLVVERREILKAYIMHILDLAKEHFKCKFKELHFSAPIKLKDCFIEEIKNILKDEYDVLSSSKSLDEGISIVYNHISNVMKYTQEHTEEESKDTSIMIIDCGGGTTDLASCEYMFNKNATGYNLEIRSKFENGDSNFGGNNITYRILQLLKIKLANSIFGDVVDDINKLIPQTESEILEAIDNNVDKDTIYKELQRFYEESEEIIPTQFNNKKLYKYDSDLKKIKRNYYYLWQLAEKIKIEFYKRTDLLSINFLEETQDSTKITVEELENFYIYTLNSENGKLEKQETLPKLRINIKEITLLLYADIYYLLDTLLDENVNSYHNYKLSGQSCKITLFNQLLKEFIPGKRLRIKDNRVNKEDYEKLKVDCVRGSIAYIKDRSSGKITPTIVNENPKLMYDVFVDKGEKIKIFDAKTEDITPQYFNTTSRIARIEIGQVKQNSNLEIKHDISQTIEYELEFNSSYDYIELSKIMDDIKENTSLNNDKLSDLQYKIHEYQVREQSNRDNVFILFTVPAKDNYGFNIYQILKIETNEKTTYKIVNKVYKNFEKNLSTEVFFDGRK